MRVCNFIPDQIDKINVTRVGCWNWFGTIFRDSPRILLTAQSNNPMRLSSNQAQLPYERDGYHSTKTHSQPFRHPPARSSIDRDTPPLNAGKIQLISRDIDRIII